MTRAQYDLFATQADLLPSEPASYAPDPVRVRGKLNAVLDQLRKAQTMPWDNKTRARQQLVFPQMTRVLPPEEAQQFLLSFDRELQRLG
ncbi:hypothetical protein [Hoeflea sp.]|uniref:hypothetical protein n=1 Tax=Hoeflea sp. TaxID=1940281 RepID=UPI0019ABFC6B|nr:hypothetical protein [Hoeflea sp.]MBC7282507.1 hypothetical protein [Hoeflea sp.]